jgi:hypothetical protein
VFDSLVQRDAHDAARGRAFARFETRFQLVWVVGGVLAVLYPGKERGGLFLLALVLLFAGLSYLGAARRLLASEASVPPSDPGTGGVDVAPEPPVRRHLRVRARRRPPPPDSPTAVGDDPPDAFPAGG